MNIESQEPSNSACSPAPRQRPMILFGMSHAGFFRNFEGVISQLLISGVDIHVHFSKKHDSIGMSDYCLTAVEANGRLTFSTAKYSSKTALSAAERVRIIRDILQYSRYAYNHATSLHSRFQKLQKPNVLSDEEYVRLRKIFSWIPNFFKDRFDSFLEKKDKKIPVDLKVVDLIEQISPDYVIVTPVVNFASRELDFVKAAQVRRIPTLLATASWDNLTNKGRIKIRPDHVAVWNWQMAKEASELHGVPESHIWVTGAPPFDRWFEQKPSRGRKKFWRSLGFNPALPVIVYFCSSESIAGKREYRIIKRWKKALNQSGFKKLRKANVLVHPHPMTLGGWHKLIPNVSSDVAEIWGLKIWPFQAKHPVKDEKRADFFDTLYHADAVVGLNTSAMIEAAILGKPVLTFLEHEATESQTGNLHFQYLAKGGFMFQAKDMDEHVRQLSTAIESPETVTEASKRFVADFIRPLGMEVKASEQLANLIIIDMVQQSKSSNGCLLQYPKPVTIKKEINRQEIEQDCFIQALRESPIRSLQLAQIFPEIESQAVEVGAIDPDTKHINHVDMLYVCAIARHVQARRIFEFGTYLGRTTFHLALGKDAKGVLSLDLDPSAAYTKKMKIGRAVHAVHERGLQGYFFRNHECEHLINQLHGDSRTFDYSPYQGNIDFIFIDGGHTYDLISNDTDCALRMLSPGGIIVWHDFASKSQDVVTFAKKFSKRHPLFWIQNTSLLVYIDGIDPMTYDPPIAPYSRSILKPK